MSLQSQPHPVVGVSSCHRHPSIPITGFCAQCLTDRLHSHPISVPRSKSYSAANPHPLPDPRRSSCDVRPRNTLWDLFRTDNNSDLHTLHLGLQLKLEDQGIRVSEVISWPHAPVAHLGAEKVDDFDEGTEVMTMKEHIDLEWQSKNITGRDLKGNFWKVTSVFSNKLGKWKWKRRGSQKMKDVVVATEAAGKRETRSEVGDYGFGRRSCDTDPRMSLDVEPNLTGTPHPRLAPLVSVAESANEEQKSPGGLEIEQVKSISNAETIGLFHGAKLLITERQLLESNWNQPSGSRSSVSVSGSGSESTHSGAYDTAPVAAAGQKGWHKIWGSIQKQRHHENKCQGEDKYLSG